MAHAAAEADEKAGARLQAEWAAEAALLESEYARDSAAVAAACEALQSEKDRMRAAEAQQRHLQTLRAWDAAQEARNAAAVAAIVAHSAPARQLAERREKLATLEARLAQVSGAEQRAAREAEAMERQLRGNEELAANRVQLRAAAVRQQSAAATLDVLREDHAEELGRLAAALAAARAACADAAALQAAARLCRSLEANRDAAVQQVRAMRVAAKARTRQ